MHTHVCHRCGSRFRCDGSGCELDYDTEHGPTCASCATRLCQDAVRPCEVCREDRYAMQDFRERQEDARRDG